MGTALGLDKVGEGDAWRAGTGIGKGLGPLIVSEKRER